MKHARIEIPGFKAKTLAPKNADRDAQRAANEYSVSVKVTYPDGTVHTFEPVKA